MKQTHALSACTRSPERHLTNAGLCEEWGGQHHNLTHSANINPKEHKTVEKMMETMKTPETI